MTRALSIEALVYGQPHYSFDQLPRRLACYLQWFPGSGGAMKYFYNGEWSDTAPTESTISFITPADNGGSVSRNSASEYKWDIPPLGDNNPGSLCIVFCGDHIKLYHAELKINMLNKGYEDTIKIGNGARGDGDSVEIVGGRFASVADCISVPAYSGILVNGYSTGPEVCILFSDRLFSNKDFLSITALGYAESIALPRYRTTGRLDVPDTFAALPLMLRTIQGGVPINSQIETYEWDILNDELNVSALSLPVAVLDVESESVIEMH